MIVKHFKFSSAHFSTACNKICKNGSFSSRLIWTDVHLLAQLLQDFNFVRIFYFLDRKSHFIWWFAGVLCILQNNCSKNIALSLKLFQHITSSPVFDRFDNIKKNLEKAQQLCEEQWRIISALSSVYTLHVIHKLIKNWPLKIYK